MKGCVMNKPRTRRAIAAGIGNSGSAPEHEAAERWTLAQAAEELAAQACGVVSQPDWLAYLMNQQRAGVLKMTGNEVRSNDVNDLLASDPERALSPARLPSQLAEDGIAVGWWDTGMHAREWFDMAAITSKEAASLLCGSDPLDGKADPERTTTEDTRPDDFRLLLRVFLDVERSVEGHRTLLDWITIAATRQLKHGYWVHRYLEARERIGEPVVKISVEKPKGQSDGQSDPERRLDDLRKLGGDMNWRKMRWRIKGIKKLVALEKANGRSRSDEKTVRLDLKEAAEAESLAKKKKEIAGRTD